MISLRDGLADLLRFEVPPASPRVEVVEEWAADEHVRRLVRYATADGDSVSAYLLVPSGAGPFPAVVAHHQHNSEWHLGKSEVAGLAGSPHQAFGAALAKRGVTVLAPDAVCFEDRRRTADDGWLAHYNAMAYRLLEGRLLMSKVLCDAACAMSVLAATDGVDGDRIGAVGHSYGGSTVLFHAALDDRIRFAAASGAACTLRTKMTCGTGIEMSLVIPGLLALGDVDDIVKLIAPRPLLLVSATEGQYSRDADEIAPASADVEHLRAEGGHALDEQRFELIITWLTERAARGEGR